MNVSSENAVGYVCIAAVLIVAIVCFTVLVWKRGWPTIEGRERRLTQPEDDNVWPWANPNESPDEMGG